MYLAIVLSGMNIGRVVGILSISKNYESSIGAWDSYIGDYHELHNMIKPSIQEHIVATRCRASQRCIYMSNIVHALLQ
jgi:hypothetical protein